MRHRHTLLCWTVMLAGISSAPATVEPSGYVLTLRDAEALVMLLPGIGLLTLLGWLGHLRSVYKARAAAAHDVHHAH